MSTLTIDEARDLNKLIYQTPVNPSVVNKRTFKQYNFSNGSYSPGQTMQCILNSGGDAVWGPTSYIRATVTTTGAAWLGGQEFGTGFNLFRNARLTHRSGEVIEDIRDSDKLATMLLRWGMSAEDFNRNSTAMGSDTAAAAPVARTVKIVLPVKYLLGCFSRTDQYLPPGFLAGAKLELDLNSAARGLSGAGDYTIDSIQLVLDSADVYDSIKKDLLDEQMDVKRSGLQFSYPTWFSTSQAVGAGSLNVDVQRSASVAMMAFAALQSNSADTLAEDSTVFQSNQLSSWQWRLGSEYMPTQVPVAGNVDGSAESYMLTSSVWGGLPGQNDHTKHGNVAIGEFEYKTASHNNQSNVAVSLEKSAAGLQLTGEPTNNSRVLNFSCSDSNAASSLYVFLKYLRVANIMGDNVVIDA